MRLDEPAWWYAPERGLWEPLLEPAARLYWRIARRRFEQTEAHRAGLPVICVGNFTAGGTGKTPLARHICERLRALGGNPAVLTRGYGGRERGPIWVDPARHSARDVGDEALLLARTVPTMLARDRVAGAEAIAHDRAANVIVMDDGLQNPALAKDLILAVVDARRGIGNGRLIPAGPLRAPLELQLSLVDAVIVNEPPGYSDGTDAGAGRWLRQRFHGPVLAARPVPHGDVAWLGGTRVVAFTGIANPTRFFDLAEMLGATLVSTERFPDHHAFSETDAQRLLAVAQSHDAQLLTTEKDHVRLAGAAGARAALGAQARALAIRINFEERDSERIDLLLEGVLKKQRSAG